MQNTAPLYRFEELSGNARRDALHMGREWISQDDYYMQETIKDWKEKLEKIGFLEPEISYTGFWSQGDGASLTAKEIDLEQLADTMAYVGDESYSTVMKMLVLSKLGMSGFSIDRDLFARYSHENTISVTAKDYAQSNNTKFLDWHEETIYEIGIIIESYARKLSRQIYKELQETYEENTSNEAVIEMLEANDYWFLYDGRLY